MGQSVKKSDPATMPGKHGGTLKRGGQPGVPPGVLRDALKQSFAARIPFLESVADGAAAIVIRFPVRNLLKHLEPQCHECGAELKLLDGHEDHELSLQTSPPIKERLMAMDLMAKYGLGYTKELTVDTVRGKLVATIELIRETLPDSQAEKLLKAMREIWK